MEKVRDFISKHKKILFGVAALASAGGLAYYLLKQEPNTVQVEEQNNPQQQENQVQTIEKSAQGQKTQEKEERKIEDMKSRVQIRYVGTSNILELQSISQILEYSIDIAEEEYVSFTIENRQERRQYMHTDQQKYEDLVLRYNDQIEQILEIAQDKLLNALGIEKQSFEESVIFLMEKGLYQQIYMLQAAIRQKIKEKLKSSNNVSMEQTKEIIKYQVQLLNDKPEFFSNFINKLKQNPENMQMIPMVLNTLLQDLIYEKFKIEEEDQMKNMMGPHILQDPDIAQSLMQIEEAMYKLMNSLDLQM